MERQAGLASLASNKHINAAYEGVGTASGKLRAVITELIERGSPTGPSRSLLLAVSLLGGIGVGVALNTRLLESVVAQIPEVEAELSRLNRDYEVLKSKYQDLVNRREQASISRERDIRSNNIKFRVLNPPHRKLS